MKRIDEKIKEIEKKDKRNNYSFIVIIIIIALFMGYALQSEKKISQQSDEINELGQTLKEANDSLENLATELRETIETLEKSLTPTGLWENTLKSNTAKAYIDYLTQTQIEVLFPDEALDKLQNEAQGTAAWLFCGRMNGNNFTQGVSEVIRRSGANGDDIAGTKPEIGDILNNNEIERITYQLFDDNAGNVNKNTQYPDNKAWKRGVKAAVLDVKMGGDAVFIQVKY
ncbi:MAG: hypothetical protein KJO00_10990 [Bacteroidia bacterium]|nr:hypothetical protein [Bacteroidia bacterium]MBT8288537.1 hypothetical protein [Bacteroidia bacterium]NNK72310.1 hypothetical protein [Flavobacteriaceae bacterium]